MPLNSTRLAELVNRARSKPLPVVSAPPPPVPVTQRPARSHPVAPSPSPTRANCAEDRGAEAAAERRCPTPCPIAILPQVEHAGEDKDFPFGWKLKKESWHFHRRFYRVLRRPMHHGEYSYLLHQIRGGHAEHLDEDCWRVTLPDRRRTLLIRATSWRLITILPKNWQPTPDRGLSPPAPQTGAVPPS